MARDILDIGGYTIKKRIGVGARTTIYLATDDSDGKEIALKRVILERPEDVRIFEQVETEFKIAQKITHPYIRKCYKLKKIRSMLKTKEMLLAMEYFDGQSLEEGPALSLLDVMLVFRMVATGLNAMHQCGLAHCDIKPNNILLNKTDGAIRIIDLGQSCRIGTTKRRIQGTPDYIAPEQVQRKPLGPKTDIFNLGATMYWALTGRTIPTMIPKKDPDPKDKIMSNKQEALGILETQGLTAILEATDAMLKSADVTLVGKEKIGAAYVTVIVKGDVAAVTAAIEAGAKAVGPLGKLIAAHVIARPHDDLVSLLPK